MLFIKAIVIGLCIAAPVGPIGMLCIQRSLSRGFRSGLATGLGAACADMLYGLLGALGVAGFVTAFPAFSLTLKIAGGAFLVWIAWSIVQESRVPKTAAADHAPASHLREFGATFLLTLSNPMTVFSFIAVFAALGPVSASGESAGWPAVLPMVTGVFLGSALWWLFLSGLSAALRMKMPASLVRRIGWISGAAVALLGIAQVMAGLRSMMSGA